MQSLKLIGHPTIPKLTNPKNTNWLSGNNYKGVLKLIGPFKHNETNNRKA